jgi:hypothetical protein
MAKVDPLANANPPVSTWAAAVSAGYLGIAVDPTPNLNYTVAGVVQPLPTPESQYKQIRAGGYAVIRASVSGDIAPAPTLASLAPPTILHGTLDMDVLCIGTNFDLRSVVRHGGVDVPTTFVSATQIYGRFPIAAQASAGAVPITVFTSAPGGGTSGAVNFTYT